MSAAFASASASGPPRAPVHRVAAVLQEIGAGFGAQKVLAHGPSRLVRTARASGAALRLSIGCTALSRQPGAPITVLVNNVTLPPMQQARRIGLSALGCARYNI